MSSESLLVSCPELKHRKPVVWGCSSVEEYIPSLHEVLCSLCTLCTLGLTPIFIRRDRDPQMRGLFKNTLQLELIKGERDAV